MTLQVVLLMPGRGRVWNEFGWFLRHYMGHCLENRAEVGAVRRGKN